MNVPDLDAAACADQLHEQVHEGALLRRDLHAVLRHRLGLGAQPAQHVRLADPDLEQVGVDGIGQAERLVGHARSLGPQRSASVRGLGQDRSRPARFSRTWPSPRPELGAGSARPASLEKVA